MARVPSPLQSYVHNHDLTYNKPVWSAKTQLSLCILPVWQEYPDPLQPYVQNHDKTYNKTYMTSKDSSHSVHPPSISRVPSPLKPYVQSHNKAKIRHVINRLVSPYTLNPVWQGFSFIPFWIAFRPLGGGCRAGWRLPCSLNIIGPVPLFLKSDFQNFLFPFSQN